MKDKHERLYVAIQDLLIELGFTPEDLRDIAARKTHGYTKPTITARTAQKLIDAGLIVEEINWRRPGNVFGPHQEVNEEEQIERIKESVLSFDKIKSGLAPLSLWSYLREKHPEFLFEQIKDYLFPSN